MARRSGSRKRNGMLETCSLFGWLLASREAAEATTGTRALLRLGTALGGGDWTAAAAAFRWAITCEVLAGTKVPALPLAMVSSPVVGRRPTPLLLVAAKAPAAIELPVTEVAAD